MRIAQLSPLFESVPPSLYGGTERVVSYLTEELVKAGHEVALFASGDSVTEAELVPLCEKALRLDPGCKDPCAYHFIMMEEVLRRQDEFDIIHSHIECAGFILGRRARTPVVSTLHGRLDYMEHRLLFNEFRETPVISISKSQRKPLPFVNWVDNVYHGIPARLYRFNPSPGGYLAFVGRVSPEKKVDTAIEIALKAGIPLKIAAKVDKADEEYYQEKIRPLLGNPLVEFLGEVNDIEKGLLVGGALAFLHPVDWPEPFGLAMIEAMACGTPVIARRRGSIPEVVDHGVTGFIFEDTGEAVRHIKRDLPYFSRKACRRRFEERFLSSRMASDYLSAYSVVLNGEKGGEQCLKMGE